MNKKQNSYSGLVLSREQVRKCDRAAIDQYGIDGLVLMENAGIGATGVLLSMLSERENPGICILAGSGNNGGDGYVVARHLQNGGADVKVLICSARDRIKGDALSNLLIIERMAVPVIFLGEEDMHRTLAICRDQLAGAEVVVDAMLGTGTAGPPREPMHSIIELLNRMNKSVLALDTPSGLDCDTGLPLGATVRAQCTVTFAAMKKGFLQPAAHKFTGKIEVVSIGIDTKLLQ